MTINFTQFYHLLLEIAEIVYPEIYTDPGPELHMKSTLTQSVTDTGISQTNNLGKTRAFQKILIVSFQNKSMKKIERYCNAIINLFCLFFLFNLHAGAATSNQFNAMFMYLSKRRKSPSGILLVFFK